MDADNAGMAKLGDVSGLAHKAIDIGRRFADVAAAGNLDRDRLDRVPGRAP